MLFIVSILANVFLAQGSIPEDNNPRIVDGADAPAGTFPFQLSLQYDGKHFCGASILTELWAVTAAHCLIDFHNKKLSLSKLKAYGGSHKLDKGGSHYGVDKVVVHPDYKHSTLENDAAVFKFAQKIKFTDKITSVKLPDKDAAPGTMAMASGFGYTDYDKKIIPNHLQYINATIISIKECKEKLKYTRPHSQYLSSEMHVCAEGKENSFAYHPAVCSGDSGGPLSVTDSNGSAVMFGMTSWTMLCGKGYPDTYANAYKFKPWILQTTK